MDFAEDALGIRVVHTTGPHDPYRLSFVSTAEALEDTSSSMAMDVTELQASCSGDLDPETCQQELRILLILLEIWNIEGEGPDELRDILADPGVLLGTAEILRMVLKSVPVTQRIPDNAAVARVLGPWTFTYDQGWLWRGSAMESMVASTHPGTSVEVRPTRGLTPSTH